VGVTTGARCTKVVGNGLLFLVHGLLLLERGTAIFLALRSDLSFSQPP
jgi:hypothetical protein